MRELSYEEAFEILGIPPTTDKKLINKAYRTLAAKYHPDRWSDKPEDQRKRADNQFKLVAAAKKVADKGPQASQPRQQPTNSQQQGGYQPGYVQPQQRNRQSNATWNGNAPRPHSYHNPNQDYSYIPTGTSQPQQQQQRASSQPRIPFSNGQTAVSNRTQHDFGSTVPDPQEVELRVFYSQTANSMYSGGSDSLKWAASMVSTAILFAALLYLLFVGAIPSMGLSSIVSLNVSDLQSFGVIAIFLFIKLFYDMLISWRFSAKMKRRGSGWIVAGIDGAIAAIVCYVILPKYDISGGNIMLLMAGAFIGLALVGLILFVLSKPKTAPSNKTKLVSAI